jgi:hypothetical protein
MTERTETQSAPSAKLAPRFSLDTWAVFFALGLSALIWIGVIKHVPW